MLPADECLHGDELSGGEEELRLVVEQELAALEGAAELADEGEAV